MRANASGVLVSLAAVAAKPDSQGIAGVGGRPKSPHAHNARHASALAITGRSRRLAEDRSCSAVRRETGWSKTIMQAWNASCVPSTTTSVRQHPAILAAFVQPVFGAIRCTGANQGCHCELLVSHEGQH